MFCVQSRVWHDLDRFTVSDYDEIYICARTMPLSKNGMCERLVESPQNIPHINCPLPAGTLTVPSMYVGRYSVDLKVGSLVI